MKKNSSLFVALIIIALFFTGCGNKEKKVVDIVKNGVFNDYPGNSVKDFANDFFIEPKYTAFQDINEDWYVEISGIVNWENFEKNFTVAAHNYIMKLYDIKYPDVYEINVDVYKTFIEPDMLPTMSFMFKDAEMSYKFRVNPKVKAFELKSMKYAGSDVHEYYFSMYFGLLVKDYKLFLEDLMPELYTPRNIYYIE